VRSHPTAGQATLEYIAAVALLAALLLVAAPAVGAPDIARGVSGAIEHGLCVVGGDVCSTADARRAGLAPCPLTTKTTGWDGGVSVMIVDVGGRFTLAVTKRSDGSVSIVRTVNAGRGITDGIGASLDAGPIHFELGADGAITKRFQAAVGWEFRDEANAARFLEHSLRNAVRLKRWPPSWVSTENASEVAASIGLDVGGSDHDDRYQVIGASAFAQLAGGARRRRDGSATFYSRTTLDGPEFSAPLAPAKGRGRTEWVVELTVDAEGRPVELAFRNAAPSDTGNALTEVVKRLDLRDPGNLAAALPLLRRRLPWPTGDGPRKETLKQRLISHGITETSAYRIDDDTKGASGSLKAMVELGLSVKKVSVMKTLVASTVTRGALTGKRLDCVPERVERVPSRA
jgi:hypothetical protein